MGFNALIKAHDSNQNCAQHGQSTPEKERSCLQPPGAEQNQCSPKAHHAHVGQVSDDTGKRGYNDMLFLRLCDDKKAAGEFRQTVAIHFFHVMHLLSP